jgi:hypothetical protein
MKAVQNLDYQYVVATDLAARGLILRVSVILSMMAFRVIWNFSSIVWGGLAEMG